MIPFLDSRGFVVTRLLSYAAAEVAFVLGNVSPHPLAALLWRVALRLNPHHIAAALNLSAADPSSEQAFEELTRAIDNPLGTSASDLALTWVPARLLRRVFVHVLWGRIAGGSALEMHDRIQQSALVRVARARFDYGLSRGRMEDARRVLRVWESAAGRELAVIWSEGELEWKDGRFARAMQILEGPISAGRFIRPSAALEWAERFIDLKAIEEDRERALDLAARCLNHARAWLPGEPRLWHLLGRLAGKKGEGESARLYLERAIALTPGDSRILLDYLRQEREKALNRTASSILHLRVSGPARLALNAGSTLRCELTGGEGEWELWALPPNGRGVAVEPRHQTIAGHGAADVQVRARRPDRICGGAWQVTLLAICGGDFTTACWSIAVPDEEPGQLIVVATEDHEIHEERGRLSAALFKRLLVEKSALAASRFKPWTHMVETGSTLALTEWAAQAGGEWDELAQATRDHLASEVAGGNDIQPHLHAFNVPTAPHFPYTRVGTDLVADYRFLLTAEERRRDWADAYPIPASDDKASDGWRDRFTVAADAVARVEEIGRLGDPDYHAVLWRSGQLEFGSDAADREWSAAALLRAGLVADSDLLAREISGRPPEAFLADICDPFVPHVGGRIAQLPIWGNLEGNFTTGVRQLERNVASTVRSVQNPDGSFKPGVHLYTLLTHDKFINARRGAGEFQTDPNYGDWRKIRQHLDGWQRAGARRVTARDGVLTLLDDLSWRVLGILHDETYFNCVESGTMIRYRVRLIGSSIMASADDPQHILVSIPPILRKDVEGIEIVQGSMAVPAEREGKGEFWLVLSDLGQPIYCYLRLASNIGPRVTCAYREDGGTWRVRICADAPYCRSRLMIPWSRFGVDACAAGPGPVSATGREVRARWIARRDGATVDASADSQGVYLDIPPFAHESSGSIQENEIQVELDRQA